MNHYLFNRAYSLTIGYPNSQNEARVYSGLRCSFDITKSEMPGSNSCTVKINNLSDDSRAFIKEGTAAKDYHDGMTIILKAGYEEMGDIDNLPTIFTGNIMTSTHDTTRPEVETVLTCWDAAVNLKTSHFSGTYPKGTKISQIINDIVSALSLNMQTPIGNVLSNNTIADIAIGWSWAYHGNAADALRKCCDRMALRFSVQNNKVKIYPVRGKNGGAGSDGTPAFSAFLIGSPKRMAKMQAGIEMLDFGGYDFDVLLCPLAEPGNTVNLSASSIENSPVPLVVSEVHHQGDTHGEDWKSSIKGRKP